MLINVHGGNPSFRGEETYRVTVYVDGHKVGETHRHRSSREWAR